MLNDIVRVVAYMLRGTRRDKVCEGAQQEPIGSVQHPRQDPEIKRRRPQTLAMERRNSSQHSPDYEVAVTASRLGTDHRRKCRALSDVAISYHAVGFGACAGKS